MASGSTPTLGNREVGRGVGCETGAGNMLTGDIRECFWFGGIDGGIAGHARAIKVTAKCLLVENKRYATRIIIPNM